MPRPVQMLIDGTFEKVQEVSLPLLGQDEMRSMMEEMQRQEGLLNFRQAATLLGISRPRVSQLVQEGTLTRFTFGGHHYVSMKQVRARSATEVKAGRPKRSVVERAALSVKAAFQTDRVQAKQGGYAGHNSRKVK